MREKYPQLFFSQFSNKLIYTQIGTMDLINNETKTILSEHFKLVIDKKQINIDDFESIILLNIDNWGGGVTGLWRSDSRNGLSNASFSDGLIEVIGFSDVLHMAQVQVGMEEPFRLGQGKCVQLKSKSRSKIITLQIDGEPLEFITPFQILIERKDQINVLATQPSENGKIIHFLR